MGKKAWIIYISLTVAIFVIGSLCMLMLVPQSNSYTDLPETYIGIDKNEFTFKNDKDDSTLSKEYDITNSDINSALRQDKYEQGNINPFTPKGEVTIYNEPTLKPNNNGSKPLTPSDK